MAQITGSSTIDWSGISVAQVDFDNDLVTFANELDRIINEVENGLFDPVFLSPTLVIVDLHSGGRLTLGGSGFDTLDSSTLNSFNFRNPPDGTGEVVRWTGTFDGIGKEIMTSATIGSTGFSETIKGKITFPAPFPDPTGNYTGTLTSLVVKIGTATGTLLGNFSLTGDRVSASLTGTVNGISVVSGANTIKMTGLSLSLEVLGTAIASGELADVNDLFSVVGNQLASNDVITYNSTLGIELFGGAGNDRITGGTGPDTLHGGTDNDTLNGVGGNDTLLGEDGNDILTGGLGQDTVNGGAGDDRITLLVTAGNVDSIDAGADTDTLVLRGVVPGDHVVVVDLSSSTDQVVSIGGVADALTQTNAENLTASGLGSSVTVTGSDGDNIIIGTSGNDSLDGGAGNDTLNGGRGNDTYSVDSAGDVVTEALNAGTDKVVSSIDYTLGANVENLELTGSALNGTGNARANVLTGNSGVNVLTGGAGNDTYIVQNDADSVVENLNAGIDLVQSAAASFTLGANVEKLTLIDSTDINGTGNALANVLTGNSGHNQLSGDAGNDRLIGGVGNDTLDGGAGTDIMAGGAGDDTYVRDVATDVVSEALNAGTDTVLASLNYRLGANVENLELTGSALNGTGNALANVITGNNGHNRLSGLAGNDQLDGGDGNDTVLGGLGQDTVNGGTGDDRITMLVTAGNEDTIDAGADTDTLVLSGVVPGDHVVVVDLSSSTDQVVSIGGVLDDTLAQINFENLTATGLGSSVTVTGSFGDNVIIGASGNDSITGGAGNDTITGGAGGDTLDGGIGNDTLIGGTGNDTFHFGLGDGQDLVRDNSGSADKILYDAGINPLDLVISRQANDLQLAIHGSSDQITVQNWYTSSVNRTETIQAGDGQTLLSTQVNQLIQAMAGFTQQTGLSWDQGIEGTPEQLAQVQSILAASWQ